MEIRDLTQSELVETNGGSIFLLGVLVGFIIGYYFLD